MLIGRHSKRPGFALRFIVPLGVLALGSGCQRLPMRAGEPAATALDKERNSSTAPLRTDVADIPQDRAGTIVSKDMAKDPAMTFDTIPTPLLDAALAREQARSTPPSPTSEPDASVDTIDPIPLDAKRQAVSETTAPVAAPVESIPAAAVVPAPKSINPDRPVERVAPSDSWRDGLEHLRTFARTRAGSPGESAELWIIRSRLLDWMAGGGAPETAGSWKTVLTALTTATDPETPDDELVGPRIREGVEALTALAPLEIEHLALCRRIHGFGGFDPLAADSIRAGQKVLIYCELAGLRSTPTDDGYLSRLSSQVEIVHVGGGDPVWSQSLGIAEDRCRRPRRDYYINYRITLPANLASGAYELRLTQTDLTSDRMASRSLEFTVQP
jgi:hypothetical protein